jgi:hypothetical protein
MANASFTHRQFYRINPDMSLLVVARNRLCESDNTNMGKYIKGSEDGVPGEGDFLQRREKAEANIGARGGSRKHKNGLREIHLSGDFLHFPVGKARRIGNNSYGITPEYCARKDIGLIELDVPPT